METITNLKKNQVMISDGTKTKFWSYKSLIFTYDHNNKELVFGKDWNYSKTTLRHLAVALAEIGIRLCSKKEIEKAIKEKKYEEIKITLNY